MNQKNPLREYCRPYELPLLLKKLGAKKANENNIKYWLTEKSIAPKSKEDFIAVLKFANIIEDEQIEIYFKMASNMRSTSISLGHKKADLAKEIIKKEIMKLLKNSEPITDELCIGNLKAEILRLKEFQ